MSITQILGEKAIFKGALKEFGMYPIIQRRLRLLGTTLVLAGAVLLFQNTAAQAKKVGGAYIASTPPGAPVQLDNEPAGTTPALLTKLTPGEHYLKITMPGYYPMFTTIEIKEDELKDFKYNLEPMQTTIFVNTSPSGADIFLDGKFVGRSPKRINDLLVIDHWIKINQSGYQLWEKQISLEEGKVTKIEVDLEKTPSPPQHKQKGDCRTKCHELSQAGAKLTFSSEPPGATVYLQGEPKGETPLTLYLYPGKYTVHIQKNDYIPQQREIDLDFKQDVKLNFILVYDQSWQDMVYVPAGEFVMGSGGGAKDEQPVHKVYLDAFYIAKYEVTNRQYRQFVRDTRHRQPAYPHDPKWGDDAQPVIGISWEDANAYAKWTGKRLPTEAEWEKTAKGLKLQRYPWGNEWQLRSANTIEAGKKITTNVGSYPYGISPFGTYDMLGNVWEWCSDWYSATYYQRSPKQNPGGPQQGRTRIIRGGSWNDRGELLTISTRNSLAPQVRLNTVGLRCVKDIPE